MKALMCIYLLLRRKGQKDNRESDIIATFVNIKRMTIMNKRIILNPAYYLRNDIRRAIIGTFEFPNIDSHLYDAHILYRIHPVIAQLLSFFCHPVTITQAVARIHKYFGLESQETLSILAPMINNETSIQHDYDGVILALPKNVLIDYDKVVLRPEREQYLIQDFVTYEPLDLSTIRLYKPVHMIIELTMKCYTDCVYCYADRSDKIAMQKQLALKIIDEAYRLKFTNIELNGGEVLSHPGIWEILNKLSSYGYYPLISTKMPLGDEQLRRLKDMGFSRIQISLDSINAQIEKNLVKASNNYLEKVINTMDALDSLCFDWQINTVLTNKNCTETGIKDLLNYVLCKYKHLKSIKLAPMGYPMYKNENTFRQLAPDYYMVKKIQHIASQMGVLNKSVGIIISEPDLDTNYTCKSWEKFNGRNYCTANQKAFNVLPDGKVTICEELSWTPAFIIGDLNSSNILEVWNSDKAKHLFFLDQKEISNTSKCKECGCFIQCRHNKQVCWKMVIMAYGKNNWDYPDPQCPNSELPYNSFYYKQNK